MINQYPVLLRLIHWVTALIICVLLGLGFWMTERAVANLWDELTNVLYAWHKLLGFTVLLLTALRITVKSLNKRPDYPSNFSLSNMKIAHGVQGVMYLLLVLIPLVGWAGVTAYPALMTLGGLELPALPGISKDEALAKQLFTLHHYLVFVFIAIATCHIVAGLKHLWSDKDQVFNRIWFRSK